MLATPWESHWSSFRVCPLIPPAAFSAAIEATRALPASGRARFAPVIGRIWPTTIGVPWAFTFLLVELALELDEQEAVASRATAASPTMALIGFRDMFPPAV